jgi:PAS domain S-box-containing protein
MSASGRADAATLLLAAQSEIARILAESATLAQATPRVLEAIGRTLDWEVGAVWEVDARAGVLRQVHRWAAHDSSFEETTRTATFEPGVGLPGRVWQSGEAAWIADVSGDGNFPRLEEAAEARIRGAFAFPIAHAGRVLGVVELFTADSREPDDDMCSTMASLGSQLGAYMERRRAEEEALASEALKAAVIASALDAVITLDADGRVLEFNPAAERMFGHSREEALGREMAALIVPPDLRERHRRGLARVAAGGEARVLGERLELSGMRADGTIFPVELTITRIPLDGPPVFTGYVRDITERRQAERERAAALEREHAERRRAAFLADASARLDDSLEVDRTLETIAGLPVPAVADWCLVDLIDEAGDIVHAALAHTDSGKRELGQVLRDEYVDPELADHGAPAAVRTGASLLYPSVGDEVVRSMAQDERHLEVLRALGVESAMVVPMVVRGRTLGAITFVASEGRGPFSENDLELAEEIARRATTALDNARLYTERSRVARTLQQSLLPPGLPGIPGLELASRFLAAGEGIDVGGDFYDVFETGPSHCAMLIGDVCGKGPDAAAVTALARYTLRAAAMREPQPSRVLRLLNEAMLHQRADRRFCTVAFATLELSERGAEVCVSSGGHPPALLLRGDGSGCELVGNPGTLIGAFGDVRLDDARAGLRPGDTLVLYTDGVLEAGAPARVIVPEELAEIIQAAPVGSAEDVAREIEESVLAPETRLRDDVAILVARIL